MQRREKCAHIEYLQIPPKSALVTSESDLLKFEQFARIDGITFEKNSLISLQVRLLVMVFYSLCLKSFLCITAGAHGW